jgi:hypothetical protein
MKEQAPDRLSSAAYHSDFARDSNSSLSLFEESRPRYEAVRIKRTMPPRQMTPDLQMGCLVHGVTLEPETYKSHRLCSPDFDRYTDGGKLVKVDQELFDRARAMRDAMASHPEARQLLFDADGVNERSIFWTDDETGLPLKCRPDRLLKARIVVDIKTTDDVRPWAFSKDIDKYGYHKQAALYLDGVQEHLAELVRIEWFLAGEDVQFVWVVASKQEPHEVAVYTLDEHDLNIGREENRKRLRDLAACKASGDFRAPYSRGIQTIGLPRWRMGR